jgi:hypothetical protein
MAQARSHGVLGPPLGQVRPDVTTDTETILTGLEKFHDDFDPTFIKLVRTCVADRGECFGEVVG